jgi:hypothetical protein
MTSLSTDAQNRLADDRPGKARQGKAHNALSKQIKAAERIAARGIQTEVIAFSTRQFRETRNNYLKFSQLTPKSVPQRSRGSGKPHLQ